MFILSALILKEIVLAIFGALLVVAIAMIACAPFYVAMVIMFEKESKEMKKIEKEL